MAEPIKIQPKTAGKTVGISPALVAGKPVEEIVWTALPNGIRKGDKNYLKLSVYVAPRLRVADTPIEPRLASFPDFIDWPAKAKAIEFDVQFGNSPKMRATKVSPEPDSSLWTAVFKKSTKVESFTMSDYPNRPILDYPSIHVHDYIKTKYQTVGVDPRTAIELPTLGEIAHEGMFGRVALGPHQTLVAAAGDLSAISAGNKMPLLKQKIASQLDKSKAFPHSPAADPEMDFARVVAMHEPFVPEVKIPTLKAPELDFHSALSSLAKYPHIMRLLGLVVDLEIELTGSVPQSSTVRVTPDWGDVTSPAVSTSPKTAYRQNGSTFASSPKPQDSDIEDGFLRFDSDAFEVVTLDVDAAANNTMAMADNAVNAIKIPNSAKAQEPSGLPALRTGGISLVRNGRAEKTHKAVKAAAAIYNGPDNGGDAVLYADDLMRGFRIDVWDSKSKTWNSLCRRKGLYKFIEIGKELEIDDEGFVSSAVTKAPEGSDSADKAMRQHQSMFTWSGWSLCAPRPGKAITLAEKPGDLPSNPGTEFKLKTTFKAAPGSLPKLRYGNAYRLRARVVDLAGNSLQYDEPDPADFSHATTPTVYSRYEPVASPVVVLRKDPKASSIKAGSGAGPAPKNAMSPTAAGSHAIPDWGSPGESVERLVIRSFNKKIEEDGIVTKSTTDRHIVPPKAVEQMAEVHGMLDDAGSLSKENYDLIAAHDGGLKEIVPEDSLHMPYLPDPLAFGASLKGLPGMVGPKQVEFYDGEAWPEAKPFRLLVREGKGAPQWDAAARVLTVFLPKAEVVTFNLSSYLKDQQLEHAAIWQWIADAAKPKPGGKPVVAPNKPALQVPKMNLASSSPSKLNTAIAPASVVTAKNGLPRVSISQETLANLRNLAGKGEHWMITPSRPITIVHAVQQPLSKPKLQMNAQKFKGETGAHLSGRIAIHGKSTGEVDLVAEWEEPVDPISEKKPRTISGHAQVFEKQTAAEDEFAPFSREWQEFHDTKYRKVSYHPVATTRFREYFSPVVTNDPAGLTRAGETLEVDILNSARPAAPKVLYVVPTFGWEDVKNEGNGAFSHVRKGGGLRVYLDRPWYSSGDGELLGVVLVPQGGKSNAQPAPPNETFRPYVTMWGIDPIWEARDLTTNVPLAQQFRKAVEIGKDLSISEVPATEDQDGPKVAVAGHKVDYDEERQLWYCDIQINPDSAYYPFIRLALARYQPKSVYNTHLSRIVLAEFAQLVPDRTLVVQKKGSSLTVAVKGTGVYTATSRGKGTSEVEASLERHREGVSDEELAWLPVTNSTVRLEPHQYSALTTTWVGDISVPTGGAKYRVVVKEYERFAVDKPWSPAGTGGPDTPTIMSVPTTDRRLVYADALVIG